MAQANLGGMITLNHGYASDGLARISRINVSSGTSVSMPANTSYGLIDQTFGFESIGNLKSRSLNGSGRTESEAFGYDALDRLISSTGVNDSDTGSFGYDDAGNITNKGGLTLAYGAGGLAAGNGALGGNRLCGIGASACAAANSPGAIDYDNRGNILRYTRPTGGVSGADGATITLSGYTAFNLPTLIQKTGTSNNASASFAYDAGYQRIRQIKYGASGTQVDDILYVVPGGFEVHRNGSGQVLQSIATISGADGAIATVTTYFDPNTGLPIVGSGQDNNTANLSGSTTVTKLLIKDHLGSMVAEVVVVGTPGAPTMAGSIQVHGFGPWGNARNLAARFAEGDRGFTGHEHLAGGLIHMNGRIYDPVLGIFLSPDIVVQFPGAATSYNRYAYVMNNPLLYTDPSGYFIPVIIGLLAQYGTYVAAAMVATSGYQSWNGNDLNANRWAFAAMFIASAGGIAMAAQSGVAATAGASLVNSAVTGFAGGGLQSGSIEGAIVGAVSAALFYGAGSLGDIVEANIAESQLAGQAGPPAPNAFSSGGIGRAGMHAVAGCAMSAAGGGKCGRGAASAGFAQLAGPLLPGTDVSIEKFVGKVILGGVTSVIGGGKFREGALTAAFGFLFNECGHTKLCRGKGYSGSVADRKEDGYYPRPSDAIDYWALGMQLGPVQWVVSGSKYDGYLTIATNGALPLGFGGSLMFGSIAHPEVDEGARAALTQSFLGGWSVGGGVCYGLCLGVSRNINSWAPFDPGLGAREIGIGWGFGVGRGAVPSTGVGLNVGNAKPSTCGLGRC